MPADSPKVFVLRPAEKSDLGVISHWFHDVADLACFDRTSRIPLNQTQTEQFWNDILSTPDDTKTCWFTLASEKGEALGLAGLDAISLVNRDAVLPLFIDKSIRRTGVGIRATALLLDFAFRQLGLNRVTSYYRVDNLGSETLLKRLGFQVEGTMRQAWFADGRFHDTHTVGVLQTEWLEQRQSLADELDAGTVVAFGSAASSEWSWPPRGLSYD